MKKRQNKYNFGPSRSTTIPLHWRRTLVLFIALFSFFSSFAQFPVHITPQLISPYTLQLNDYYNGTSPKLIVTLINKDILKPTISVRLRMSIIGQSAKLTSKDYVYYPPITLDAGIPQQLSLDDLAPYFNPDNLDFQGITRAQYQQQGQLPEGFYQFCFEAIEISTNEIASLKKCASAWISLSDPPLLNLPRKAESIAFREPTNIIFNWTPRHLNSPNSAFNTEYEFQLVELWDNGIDPVAAFQTAQPLYQTTVKATTLLYGPAEPSLIPGKKYAWRVKAQAKSGIDEVDVFRNNGYSEVFWFTCQDNCQPPVNVTATVQNGRATLTWLPQPQMFEYTIEYKEKGKPGADWFSQKTNATQATIYDVQPGKTYEYRIGGSCSIGGGTVFGELKAFTIPAHNTTRDSACGILPNINITNQTPLQTLLPGDVILAGDFPVKLVQVNGNLLFTGNGYVTVPFLGEARVKVKFNNIGVNTDKQLISGVIETTFDSTMKGVYNLDDIFEGGDGVGFVKTGADTTNYTVDFVIGLPQDTVTILPATDGKGGYTIIIKDNNGNSYQLPVDSIPATIKDQDGNIYQVDKDGNLIPIGKPADLKGMTAAQLNTLASDKAVVKFVAHPDQQYAFDEWKPAYDKSALWREKYEQLSDGYHVNAKAIESGKTDKVKAIITITDNAIKPENIKFITGKGTALTYKRNNNEYEINVIGGPAGDAQELYALYPAALLPSPDGGGQVGAYLSLGKLLIASYPHQKRKLKLVPVNGTNIDENAVAATLNEIYNKVGVEWEVSKDNNFEDHSWDANNDGLDVGGSGAFSTLTAEMKALNKAYKNSGRNMDDKTAYLFVLDKAAGQANITGDMPRSKQFGYLFTNSGADLGVTAAHEVGHGVFRLKHTFDGYFDGTELASSKNPVPDNVMNYPVGNELCKLQWDALHDPGVVVGLFEGDEDGESISGSESTAVDGLNSDASDIGGSDFKFQDQSDEFDFYIARGFFVRFKNIKSATYQNGYFIINKDGGKEEKITILYSVDKNDAIIVDKQHLPQLGYDQLISTQTDKRPNKNNSKQTVYKQLPEDVYLESSYYDIILVPEKYNQKSTKDILDQLSKRTDITKEQRGELVYLLDKASQELRDKTLCKDGVIAVNCGCADITDLSKNYSDCWATIIQQLRDAIKQATQKNIELLAEIDKKTIDKGKVKDIFRTLEPENYGQFTATERIKLLSYLVTGNMKGDYFYTNEESFANNLLKYTPDGQAQDMIIGLEGSPVKMNDESKKPEYQNGSLVKNLFEKIDDRIFWVGGKNSTELIGILVKLLGKAGEELDKRMAGAKPEVIFVQNSYFNPGNNEKLLSVGFDKDKIEISQGHWNIVTESKWVAEFGGDGHEEINTIKSEVVWSDKISLRPFDIIVAGNESDVNLIEGIGTMQANNSGKVRVFPAIVARYAALQGELKNLATYAANATDVLTLLVPVTKLASAPKWLQRVYTVVDKVTKINAAANLTVNNSGLKDIPEIRTVLDEFNKVTIGLNVANLTVGISRSAVVKFIEASEKAAAKKALIEAVNDGNPTAKVILDAEEEFKRYGKAKTGNDNWWKEGVGTSAGKAFNHIPTSGAVVTNSAKQGTFLVGSFGEDLQYILSELNYPKIQNVDFNFPVPFGQKFNLLNISDAQYTYWVNNGGFFTKVNGPWIDAAINHGADIIVVSNINKFENIYVRKIINGVIVDELTGFGKEIHRLEWKHGYRFDPTTKMMVPPSKANGLPTITKEGDYNHN